MHKSKPISEIEIIEMSESAYSPLISECLIKVCYVSDDPNRNHSVITKETARKMAPSLRGTMIAGFYNEEKEDFESHKKEFIIKNGEIKTRSLTQAYGFVDINADVWFQKFLDDDKVEREYLVTKGFLWTAELPECQRVIEKGNNQSMELHEDTLKGNWTFSDKNNFKFFIVNEANISKLCILGEDCEPCFEGAQIKKEFSLKSQDDFTQILFSLNEKLNEILDKGGLQMPNAENAQMIEQEATETQTTFEQTEVVVTETQTDVPDEFKKKDDEEDKEGKKSQEDSSKNEDSTEGDNSSDDSSEEEDKKKKKEYNLAEIAEYVELAEKYSNLEKEYSAIISEKEQLVKDIESLQEYKKSAEEKIGAIDRAEKQKMVESFYMISDDTDVKKDILVNIDTYSLEDIENKLSVYCVRNKLAYSVEEENSVEPIVTYSLQDAYTSEGCSPEWARAVLEVQKELDN